MRIIKVKPYNAIPREWYDRVVTIWAEDECLLNDADAERLGPNPRAAVEGSRMGAFRRVTGGSMENDRIVDSFDGGDTIYNLHWSGWVTMSSPWGASLGVAVEVSK